MSHTYVSLQNWAKISVDLPGICLSVVRCLLSLLCVGLSRKLSEEGLAATYEEARGCTWIYILLE